VNGSINRASGFWLSDVCIRSPSVRPMLFIVSEASAQALIDDLELIQEDKAVSYLVESIDIAAHVATERAYAFLLCVLSMSDAFLLKKDRELIHLRVFWKPGPGLLCPH